MAWILEVQEARIHERTPLSTRARSVLMQKRQPLPDRRVLKTVCIALVRYALVTSTAEGRETSLENPPNQQSMRSREAIRNSRTVDAIPNPRTRFAGHARTDMFPPDFTLTLFFLATLLPHLLLRQRPQIYLNRSLLK